MIRTRKNVQLLEWGTGTNTTNQIWTAFGEGSIKKNFTLNGVTTLMIHTTGTVEKRNSEDKSVKICQRGEGMTANSDRWGEVATGVIRSISGSEVVVDITTAIKIDKRSKG